MIKTLFIVLSFTIQSPQQPADTALTEAEAVAIALEKSFDIRLETYNMEIAKNNNTIGNAGYLPTVEAAASTGRTIQNTELEFASGDSQARMVPNPRLPMPV